MGHISSDKAWVPVQTLCPDLLPYIHLFLYLCISMFLNVFIYLLQMCARYMLLYRVTSSFRVTSGLHMCVATTLPLPHIVHFAAGAVHMGAALRSLQGAEELSVVRGSRRMLLERLQVPCALFCKAVTAPSQPAPCSRERHWSKSINIWGLPAQCTGGAKL